MTEIFYEIIAHFSWVRINSLDPDEMRNCAAFHLGLHCLSKGLAILSVCIF